MSINVYRARDPKYLKNALTPNAKAPAAHVGVGKLWVFKSQTSPRQPPVINHEKDEKFWRSFKSCGFWHKVMVTATVQDTQL